MDSNFEYDIGVLLPTRGRTDALRKSVQSLYDNTADLKSIRLLLAFDRDDSVGLEYFATELKPWLDSIGAEYLALEFVPLGYIRLNEYVNFLAKQVNARWYLVWNDDAIMTTPYWDNVIRQYNNQFALLRAETNHEHPYAIFPILPKKWLEITGEISAHQLNDAWTSQIGWMLDIVITIPVMIEHERFDLTGKNNDEVYKNRPMLEGNPSSPRDFNHNYWRNRRMQDAIKIGDYLESLGYDLTHFKLGIENKINIWSNMTKLDPKGLMKQWRYDELDN
jgi:hypothetical protein